MRLTILSSVSVLAMLSLAPVQAFSAFEFIAPKATTPVVTNSGSGHVTGVTATQSAGPVVPAPIVESSNLPMPTTRETAADLVHGAVNPVMKTNVPVEFGQQAIPLTPVVGDSDALVVNARGGNAQRTVTTQIGNHIQADIQDLPPLPPMPAPVAMPSSVVPVPVMPDAPRGTRTASVPVSVMPSSPYDDVPVSSFGVVPDMPSRHVPVASASNDVVQGFGRDVPLVLALQQIVPPSYRYSFDDGISPGMNISWSGGQPWKNIIMEIAQHNNLNVDIVSNVVAFHRGGSSSVSAPSSVASAVPSMPAQIEQRVAPQEIVRPVVPVQAAPVHVAPVKSVPVKTAAKAKDGFDPLLGDDVPAKGKVDNKKILTADASTAVKASDVMTDAPSSFAMPMPIAPDATVSAQQQPVVPQPVQDRSQNYATMDMAAAMPAPAVASPPVVVEADMATSREWNAFKGETLRQALTTWSSTAGVSLVWSSEYDYPLQTDVRIASDYTGAVRTLLAGFSKAQPRPLGRLFDNQKAGAQPVLIVETQRLTD